MATLPADQLLEQQIPPRRQKHATACERCRRRKVACDAADTPNHRCTHCAARGIECDYYPIVKPMRKPAKSYVQALEERLKKMEELVDKIQADKRGSDAGEASSSSSDLLPLPRSQWARSAYPLSVLEASYEPLCRHGLNLLEEPEDLVLEASDGEDVDDGKIGTGFGYFGKSSNRDLLRHFIDLKHRATSGSQEQHFDPLPPKIPMLPKGFEQPIAVRYNLPPYTDFPPPDLLHKLVESYFSTFNLYLPLLHRPTIEQNIQSGFYLRDRDTGAIILLVCAIGSLWTVDPRIPNQQPALGPGWEWFEQVVYERMDLMMHPRLHDVQVCALMAAYLNGANSNAGSWTIVSWGIRMAQSVGAHRKKMYGAQPTAEQEQWRRAFWVLIALDRTSSFVLGRPSAIHDEDFDLDYMTECDDEYWTNPNPELAFKQPAGKPSKIAFANHLMKLLKILDFASRTIYTTNKCKVLFGFMGTEWKKDIVAELDSTLQKWLDSVPEHLHWDPNRQDLTFFNQSAFLYANYYQLQIAVHRQYIPTPRRNTAPLLLPSLTICTSAARSCISVLDAQYKRTGLSMCALTPMHMPLVTSCTVLLVHLWGGKPSEKAAQALWGDVQKCLQILKEMEVDIPSARKSRAILNALISVRFSQSSSSSSKATPADLGQVVAATIENLRASLSEMTIQGESARHPLSSHSPPCTTVPFSSAIISSAICPIDEFASGGVPPPPWQSPGGLSSMPQCNSQSTSAAPGAAEGPVPVSADSPAKPVSRLNVSHPLSQYDPDASASMHMTPNADPSQYEDLFDSLSGMFPAVESQALSDLLMSSMPSGVDHTPSPEGVGYGLGNDWSATAAAMGMGMSMGMGPDFEMGFDQWLGSVAPSWTSAPSSSSGSGATPEGAAMTGWSPQTHATGMTDPTRPRSERSWL
ncbi:fungal-specific transcription factor domain-containing protein [Daedaleopsis nitida]|nr:fungal-specific transcription factor domain-containing protein [Daedaleopsis nitida]